jgi:hypothetical protein
VVYRRQTHALSRWRIAVLSHLYIAYGYLWFVAGWRALWQAGTGRRGWAKTSRTVDRNVPSHEPAELPAR